MRSRFLFTVAFITLIFTSCNKEGELQGTVFIVTKGGVNQKLALVKVSAIPEDKMQQFVESKKSYIKGQIDKLKTAQEEYKGSLDAAQKNYDEAKKAFDAVVAEKNALTSKEQELRSKSNPFPSEGEATGEDDGSGQQAEQAGERKIQQQLQAIKQQIAKYDPLIEEARKKLNAAESQLSDIKSKSSINQLKILELLNEGVLYEGVPEGSVKAVTDADGKFVLKIPASGRFAIAAHSERRVSDSTERYYWLIWVNLEGQGSKQIMLSNQNMLGEDSDDSVFNFKELIPKDVEGNKLPL